jgi:hypothetical protein
LRPRKLRRRAAKQKKFCCLDFPAVVTQLWNVKHKMYMHKSRKQILKIASGSFVWVVGSIICAFQEPKLVWLALIFTPMVSFLLGVCFFAVLLPDSWYRHRERIMSRRRNVASRN